jgi:hypothetical protein
MKFKNRSYKKYTKTIENGKPSLRTWRTPLQSLRLNLLEFKR